VELPRGVEELGLFGPRRREGPGGATACCEGRHGCVSVVSEPRTVCTFRAEEEEKDTLIHTTCVSVVSEPS
jgi:hypothetical protein